MASYSNRQKKITIGKEFLEEFLEQRGLNEIVFYDNFIFKDFDEDSYSFIEHIWSHGDKLYKLAYRYYGNSNSFWIIGLFNNKPTDSHYKYGDIVIIPENSVKFYREVING